MKSSRVVFGLLLLLLLASRVCHVGVLWAEEDLPLAAAVQLLHGKFLYRDFWFDKPPLTAAVNVLWGAGMGWPLRLAGALWVLAACGLIYQFARKLWGEREGITAACALCFFLTFGIPAAVIPLAADLLMLVPHLAAVYLAWRGRAFWSGVAAGIALLFNSKAAFVLAACALWAPRSIPLLLAGAVLPHAIAAVWFWTQGALAAYYDQVWRWGRVYAENTFVENPFVNGLRRTLNWAGFHVALLAGAFWFWRRDRSSERWRFAIWAALSLAAVAAGWRFFPRYYFQLLPVMVLAGARGFQMLGRRGRLAVLVLLLIPIARFGPRYVQLAQDLTMGRSHAWADVDMNRDSKEASTILSGMARPGDTLFVWGFRPDLFAYTRLPAGTRFLESQPLTGVFADRHLGQSAPLEPEWTRRNRLELVQHHPTFIADGLSPFNPVLAMDRYAELRPWLAGYEEVARSRYTVIYRLRSTRAQP